MQITKIQIVTGRGPDRISVYTDFPSPQPKVTNEELIFDFIAEKGTGVNYVETYFPGIYREVISNDADNLSFYQGRKFK
jgi:hypothetical protein